MLRYACVCVCMCVPNHSEEIHVRCMVSIHKCRIVLHPKRAYLLEVVYASVWPFHVVAALFQALRAYPCAHIQLCRVHLFRTWAISRRTDWCYCFHKNSHLSELTRMRTQQYTHVHSANSSISLHSAQSGAMAHAHTQSHLCNSSSRCTSSLLASRSRSSSRWKAASLRYSRVCMCVCVRAHGLLVCVLTCSSSSPCESGGFPFMFCKFVYTNLARLKQVCVHQSSTPQASLCTPI